ncbi:heterokaryon incompatibility protein-domain-containing protein [Nemania abortiva]|nr:heterokaryon incompatibility protein-domain-containing protein [Nemania abortiva]
MRSLSNHSHRLYKKCDGLAILKLRGLRAWSLNKYQYQALPDGGKNHIRIATIHPGTSEQTIQIALRHERFDEDHIPDYEALSYAWGPLETEADMARIMLEHQKHSLPFRRGRRRGWLGVRSNLASALKQLRLETKPRDIWIDSLCIDQDNEVQKGPQVAMMGNIYGRASRVIIWLGTEARDSNRAMDLMQSLGVQINVDWVSLRSTASSQAVTPNIVDESVPLALEIDDLDALDHLFRRQWFDRLWIRQEIFRENQSEAVIHCGSASVHWHIFRCGWYLLNYKERPPHNTHPLWNRQQDLRGFMIQQQNCTLSNLRYDFKLAQCADPRDRVYAVRGLLKKEIEESIQPDYTKTVEDVYKDAVLAHFRNHTSFNILCECHFSPQWKGPSWVPDWASNPLIDSHFQWQMASGMITSSVSTDKIAGSCQLLGVCATTVTKLYPTTFKKPNLEQPFFTNIHALLMMEHRSFEDPYPSGGTIIEGYVQAMCEGQFLDEAYDYYDLSRQDVSNLVFRQICEASSKISMKN